MTTIENTVDGPGMHKDTPKTATREGSSLITLSPYTPPKKQKRMKPQKEPCKILNFDEMFGPENWVKYFEIKSSLDDFELYNSLAQRVGCDITFRKQSDIRIIEASNAAQSKKLEDLVEAEDPSLLIKKNETECLPGHNCSTK